MSINSTTSSATLKDLGVKFTTIRSELSRLSDSKEEPAFVEEFHSWNSDLHKIMKDLGDALGDGSKSLQEIEEIMGRSDETTYDLNEPWEGPPFNPTEDDFMYALYFWRGRHDFLYFKVRDDVAVEHGWHYANE